MTGVLVRPMTRGDMSAATRVLDVAAPDLLEHLVRTDPGGCWVAESGGEMVGAVTSGSRELMWVLSAWRVAPEQRRQGIGTQLLAAALHHGRGCLRAMAVVPDDPTAARMLRRAGLSLHPRLQLRGVVDRTAIPVDTRVREGSAGDRDLLDSVARRTRGAAHGADHDRLLSRHRLLVTDGNSGSGFCYVGVDGTPVLLAATGRRTAGGLLWEALATGAPGAAVTVDNLTAANEWALDVGLAAGLDLHQGGYLGLRGMKPPAPYLPHMSVL